MHFNLVVFFSWVYFIFLEIHLLHEYEHCKFYGFEIICFPGIGLDFSIAFYLMFSLQQLKYYITNFSYGLIMLFSFLGILFPGFFFLEILLLHEDEHGQISWYVIMRFLGIGLDL